MVLILLFVKLIKVLQQQHLWFFTCKNLQFCQIKLCVWIFADTPSYSALLLKKGFCIQTTMKNPHKERMYETPFSTQKRHTKLDFEPIGDFTKWATNVTNFEFELIIWAYYKVRIEHELWVFGHSQPICPLIPFWLPLSECRCCPSV